MEAILEKANAPSALAYTKLLIKKTPTKNLFHGPTTPVFQSQALNIFSRYCQKCHASGLEFPPQFLVGTEEEVRGKIKKLSHKIHFKLTNGLMPPNKRERDLLKNSGDLNKLIDYVNQFRL